MYAANSYANEHLDEAISAGIKMAGFELEPSKVTPVYWSTGLEQAKLDTIAGKMTELGFLKEKPDFSKAVMQ